MKTVFYFSVLFLFIGLSTFSQEINKLNESTSIRKGQITLKNGQTVDFKNLKWNNGIITYSDCSDVSGKITEKNTSDLIMITKTGNFAGTFAISAGLGGLCGSVLSASEPSLIIGCTVGGAVVGALIGMAVKKEIKIYDKNTSLSFYPSFNSTPDDNIYPTLSLKINF